MAEYKCPTCAKLYTRETAYTKHIASCNGKAKEKSTITKPILKWVGGKTQIIDRVLDMFPRKINNYHEPFLGGGSVLLGLLSQLQNGEIELNGKIYASDLNANLIGLYKNVQREADAFIRRVRVLTDEFAAIAETATHVNRKPATLDEAKMSRESYYYWIRSQFNSLPKEERTTVDASAMFLFMNKTCFRGVYREGPHGFNVPYGNYNNPGILDEAHIRAVSKLVKDVEFTHAPFADSLERVGPGDFVYLDPPYAPQSDKSFVSYTLDGFDKESHAALFAQCHELCKKGAHMLMSNANVDLVQQAFPEPPYKTTILSCRRAIHSKEPQSKASEVLITNRLVT